MLKVAILDDYQNIAKDFIDLKKLSSKYEFQVFNDPFENEDDAIEKVIDEVLNEAKEEYANTYNKIIEILGQIGLIFVFVDQFIFSNPWHHGSKVFTNFFYGMIG